jgi:hypothetical protein
MGSQPFTLGKKQAEVTLTCYGIALESLKQKQKELIEAIKKNKEGAPTEYARLQDLINQVARLEAKAKAFLEE